MKYIGQIQFESSGISLIKAFHHDDGDIVLYLMKKTEDGDRLHDLLSIPAQSFKELVKLLLPSVEDRNKVLIELAGGLVQSVHSKEPIDVHVVDWDNMEIGEGIEPTQEEPVIVPDGKFYLSSHFTGDEGGYPELREALKEI